MTLKEKLVGDMKAAMKAREAGRARLSVVQLVRAAVLQVEKDRQVVLDDQGVLEVLAREVKQRQDAIAEYQKYSTREAQEAVAKLEGDIKILREYMPEQMTDEEIRAVVQEAVAAVGAAGPKDMGKVMGAVVPKTRGRADGRLVNQIVKETLNK